LENNERIEAECQKKVVLGGVVVALGLERKKGRGGKTSYPNRYWSGEGGGSFRVKKGRYDDLLGMKEGKGRGAGILCRENWLHFKFEGGDFKGGQVLLR